MRRKLKMWLLIVAALLAAAPSCMAIGAGDWTLTVPVAQGQVDVWGTCRYDRVQIGPVFTWVDNDALPDGDGLGAGVVATYDLLEPEGTTLSVGDFKIPVQWFLGAKAEVMWFSESHDLDPAPSLLTGFRFGSERAGIGVIYEFALTDALWEPLAAREDRHVLSIAPYYRF